MHVRHSKCVVIVNRSHGGLESNVPDTLVKSPQLKPDRLEASLDPGGGSETTGGGFPLTLKLRRWDSGRVIVNLAHWRANWRGYTNTGSINTTSMCPLCSYTQGDLAPIQGVALFV